MKCQNCREHLIAYIEVKMLESRGEFLTTSGNKAWTKINLDLSIALNLTGRLDLHLSIHPDLASHHQGLGFGPTLRQAALHQQQV